LSRRRARWAVFMNPAGVICAPSYDIIHTRASGAPFTLIEHSSEHPIRRRSREIVPCQRSFLLGNLSIPLLDLVAA
jgi:hypothetical protein